MGNGWHIEFMHWEFKKQEKNSPTNDWESLRKHQNKLLAC